MDSNHYDGALPAAGAGARAAGGVPSTAKILISGAVGGPRAGGAPVG